MKLSELEKKDIINLKNGKKVGKIVDVEFDITNGYLIKFVVEPTSIFKNLFNTSGELTIKFSQIKKLGEDVILIDIS